MARINSKLTGYEILERKVLENEEALKEGVAIIEVDSLPISNINRKTFYKTASGVFYYDGSWHNITEDEPTAIIDVNTLPTENININVLYRLATVTGNSLHGTTKKYTIYAYNGSEWVEYVTKTQLDEAKTDPTNLNGWCLAPGKISATEWDYNEHKLAISSQGIEINRQGNTDKLEFPITNGTAVTLATDKDLEQINADGEEIANYCLGLNTRLESVESVVNSLINATEVAL